MDNRGQSKDCSSGGFWGKKVILSIRMEVGLEASSKGSWSELGVWQFEIIASRTLVTL